MREEQLIDEIAKLSKALVDFLQKNYCPHTAVLIDYMGIKVVNTELFIPISYVNNDDFYQVLTERVPKNLMK